MDTNNIDDMWELGDDNRQEVESVHGLIAYFLSRPEETEGVMDMEAECLEIIKNRWSTIPLEIRANILEYLDVEPLQMN